MSPKITHLDTTPGFELMIHFENGEVRLFDVKPYMRTEFFSELKDMRYFDKVRVLPYGRGVEWPNEQDFSRDTLYLASLPIDASAQASRTQEA